MASAQILATSPVQRGQEPGVRPMGRPRVLFIGTDLPWPLDSGYRIRTFENLRALCEFCDVTLMCLVESPTPEAGVAGLRSALPGATVLEPIHHRIHIKDQPLRLAGAVLWGLLTGRPYKVAKFDSSTMRRALSKLNAVGDHDVLHVELATYPYAEMLTRRSPRGRPAVVIDQQNVESQLLLDHLRAGGLGPLALPGRMECWRTRRYETAACAAADMVLTISCEDRDELARLTGDGSRIFVVPAVMGDAEVGRAPASRRGHNVVFVGSLSWLPNQEATRWFCDEVLPLVRARRPDVRFQLVGGGAPAALARHLERSGAEVLGYVKDPQDVYRHAGVFVAPFLSGGGVRIKLLDAMRAGLPIVSTTAGLKGLEARPDEELLVADTPADFAMAVGRLLSDAALAGRLALAAHDYLREHHSRGVASARLREAYAALPTLSPIASGANAESRSEGASTALVGGGHR